MLQLAAFFNSSQVPDMYRNNQSKVLKIFQCVTEFDIIKVLMAVEFPADYTSWICWIVNRRMQAYPKRRKNIYHLQLHNILKYLNLPKPAVRNSNSGQYKVI